MVTSKRNFSQIHQVQFALRYVHHLFLKVRKSVKNFKLNKNSWDNICSQQKKKVWPNGKLGWYLINSPLSQQEVRYITSYAYEMAELNLSTGLETDWPD